MFCKKCGKENKDAAKFCIGCGASLKGEVPRVNLTDPPEPERAPFKAFPPIPEMAEHPEILHGVEPVEPMPEPAVPVKKKSKAPIIIAAVAAVLLLAGGGCFLMRDKIAALLGLTESDDTTALDTANQKAEKLYQAAEDAMKLVSEEGCSVEEGYYLFTESYEKPEDAPDAGDVSVSDPDYFLYLLSEEYEELEELEGFGFCVEGEEIVSVIVDADSSIGGYPTPVLPEDAENMKLDEEALEYAAGERGEETEEESEAETEPETEALTEAPTEPDYEQLYYDYLQEEFVPVYGLADIADAQVTMESYGEENWLSPGGVYSAYIEDLNGDDVPEMVVFYAELSTAISEIDDSVFEFYSMHTALFTIENGEVVSQSDLLAAPWVEQHESGMFMGLTAEMLANESNNHFYYITAVETEEYTYFVFENNISSAFGDGGAAYYWAMRYNDGKLENVFSINKVSGGSMGFAFKLYEFENGEMVSDSVLWNDGSDSYDDAYANAAYDGEFIDALKAVYEDYGITTVLADSDNYAYFPSGGFDTSAPEAERILEYLVTGQYNTSGVYAVDFSFTVVDYTDLRDYVTYTPQMGMLQGTVIDAQTGDPIEGALITATAADGMVYTAESNADGNYTMEMIVGEYALSVSADGYETVSGTASTEADTVMISSVVMEERTGAAVLAEIPGSFMFMSGVGAWATELSINPDGSFEGSYFDSNMDCIYVSDFTGRFTDVMQVDDYTYSMTMMSLEYEVEPDTEKIIDGMPYYYTTAYGIENAGTVYLYTPETPVSMLSSDCLSWLSWVVDPDSDTLGIYVLYSENDASAFYCTGN